MKKPSEAGLVSQSSSHSSPTRAPAQAVGCGILLFGATTLIALGYGFQYRADSDDPLGYFLPISGAFFACVILLVVAITSPTLAVTSLTARNARTIGLGLMLFSLLLTLFFHDDKFTFPIALAAGAFAAIGAVSGILDVTRAVTSLVLILGLSVQTFLALSTPLDVQAANMLPIIGAGCEVLLQSNNPYLTTYVGVASEPLYYLPALVAPYCAPVALGIDMRVLNVVLLLLIVGYAAWVFEAWKRPECLSLGLFPLLLSPPVAQMMIHGHIWTYWFLVLAFVHALATRRFVAAALFLGLMLATRQVSLFLAIPAASYMATRLPPAALMRYCAITIATYLVVMAPVMLTTPGWAERFYLGLSAVGTRIHLTSGNPMNQISISGLLTELGFAGLLQPLQAVVLLLICVAFWIWRRQIDFPRALLILGLAYVLTIGLNTFLHRYFYIPGLILLALGIAYAVTSYTAWDERRRIG